MTDIETIINRITHSVPAPRNSTIPHPPVNEPQALVLILIRTECENCNHVTTSHNPHMMVRYGQRTDFAQSIQHTRADCARFAHLPRETTTRFATSPYCPECF